MAFESDKPEHFVDLVMELRHSEATSYTVRDTPRSLASIANWTKCSIRWAANLHFAFQIVDFGLRVSNFRSQILDLGY